MKCCMCKKNELTEEAIEADYDICEKCFYKGRGEEAGTCQHCGTEGEMEACAHGGHCGRGECAARCEPEESEGQKLNRRVKKHGIGSLLA